MPKDYRKNQKVVATLTLDDHGQDFTEIDVLENGVILGNSVMFKNGRLTMIGIGSLDGIKYWTFDQKGKEMVNKNFDGCFIYFKDTGENDPLPWKADTIKYLVVGVAEPDKPNRFINPKKSK